MLQAPAIAIIFYEKGAESAEVERFSEHLASSANT
jgi:hypothetical protein